MDALERKDIRADQIDKVEIKDQDSLAGKYISKVRRAASRAIAKRLTWLDWTKFIDKLPCVPLHLFCQILNF